MDMLHYVKLPLGLPEQQSPAPHANAVSCFRAKADAPQKSFLVSSAKACVRSFGFEWLRRHSSHKRISQVLSSRRELAALPFPAAKCESAVGATLEKNSVFAKGKRLGRKHSSKHRVLGQVTQDSQEDHSAPAKKLRKLSDTASDSVHVFSSVQRVGMTLGGSEGSESGTASDGQAANRKNRSLREYLNWEAFAASAAAGGGMAVGFRELCYRHSKVDVQCNGGNDTGQNWGSGGGWSGSGGGQGGGGGGQGGDKLGPGDFNANAEGPSLADLTSSEQDMEEEHFQNGFVADTQGKSDGIDVASIIEDLESRKVHWFAPFNAVAGDSMPEDDSNEIEDLTSDMADTEESQRNFMDGLQNLFPSLYQEYELMTDAELDHMQDYSEGSREGLNRAVSVFHSDLSRSSMLEEPNVGQVRLNPFPVGPAQEHHLGGDSSWSHIEGEIQATAQELDNAFGRESFSGPLGIEMLEKMKALNLESVQPSSGTHPSKEQHLNEEQGPARTGQETVHQGTGNGVMPELSSAVSKTGLGGLSLSDSMRVSSSTGERQLASQEGTFVPIPLESESSTAVNHMHGQSQDVLDWLAGLVHSIIAKRTGGQGRSCNEAKEVEERDRKALVDETVAVVLKQLFETEGNPVVAKRSETEALRRLQREAFSDLLKIRERLDKIEQLTGVRRSNSLGNPSGVARTQLKGEVKAGTALVMLEDSNSRHSRSSLEQAGMQTGLDVRFTFETPFRERDLLITQCVAGQGSSVGDGRALGGPISLGKVLYSAHINDDFSLSFAPLGAQGKDVTEIVNPLQDQALTEFSSNGPALFSHCKGSALGATVSGTSFALSLAQYLSGWGNQISAMGPAVTENDPLCLSTLGQFLFQPSERMLFSLSGLNRYWPSPPLPSSMGLHWSEMGPLIIPKIQSQRTSRSTLTSQASTSTSVSHANSIGSNWGAQDLDYCNDILESKGTAMQSFAVATEMELGENVSLGGWAQIERGDWLQDSDTGNLQWALSLAKTSGSGADWGVSIGGSRPDFWSTATSDQESYPGYSGGTGESYGPQLHLEAFLKLNCGRGFTLQPGLLYVSNKHSHTPALMLRSSWSM